MVKENNVNEVHENIDNEANENRDNDVNYETNDPKRKKTLNDVYTNELECPLHTQENSHSDTHFVHKMKVDYIVVHIMMWLFSMLIASANSSNKLPCTCTPSTSIDNSYLKYK